ncbi:MAG: hypothetical protein EA401_02645 [Planctomycetota bacterium]|nr:MAG: hypothetical protein EA401_02645 [Planctomycetota bacterium]
MFDDPLGRVFLATDSQALGGLSLHWERDDDDRSILVLRAGREGFTGSAQIHLPLPWQDGPAPWFFLPGFFYGQGRKDPRLVYPALGPQDADDPWTAPSWDFALDRLAAPLALAHRDGHWLGLAWDPHYTVSDPQDADITDGPAVWGESEPQVGCGIAWNAAGGGLLRLNIPANERPVRHARNRHNAATDKRLWLGPGQEVRLWVGLVDQPGDAHGYQQPLAALYTYLRPQHGPARSEPMPLLLDCAVHGLLAWHWVDDPGYWVYTTAYDRSAEFNANNKGTTLGWHFESLGFVGGFPVAFGLLWAAGTGISEEGEDGRAVAERCLTRWCEEGQSEWGFFRGSYHPGPAQTANGAFANPAPTGAQNADGSGKTPFYGSCWQGDQRLVHARTTADASYYLARCLSLLDAEHPMREQWLQSLRRSCEAALSVQDDAGRFGQLYNLDQRSVAQHEGAGGLLWIPALDAAAPLFDADPAFQQHLEEAMFRAAEGYAQDVEAEYICGAPEDVSLAPTSEDGYNAILAYAAIYRRSKEPRWLALWRRAADWTLTWRKLYNVRFPPRNLLGAGDFRTVGGDFASSNNNHLHVYGCNCLAELHRLSDLTGDDYYRQRADENLAFTSQLLSTVDGQWNGQRGMLSEQFYTNDWSIWGDWDPTAAHVQKGTIMGFSHVWCINMVLLGLEQMQQVDMLDQVGAE